MSDGTPKKVLVIDDATLVRLYYRGALEAAGFQVSEALNGLEALEQMLGASFDLLIVDVNMPQMDGLTFLRALREGDLPMAAVPAMVTSTESAPQRVADAVAAGANYYAVKPLGADVLVQYASLLCGARHG